LIDADEVTPGSLLPFSTGSRGTNLPTNTGRPQPQAQTPYPCGRFCGLFRLGPDDRTWCAFWRQGFCFVLLMNSFAGETVLPAV
jgi:hypothetical protein